MRPFDRASATWIGIGVATAIGCGAFLVRLPPPARPADPIATRRPATKRRLTIASAEGLLVVESAAAFRLSPSLSRTEIAWPRDVHVNEIRSVALLGGALAMWYGDENNSAGVLVIEGDRARVIAPPLGASRHFEFLGVHQAQGAILGFYRDGALAATPITGDGGAGFDIADYSFRFEPEQVAAAKGVLFFDGEPYLVDEHGAHLVLLLSQKRWVPSAEHFTAVWSASTTYHAASGLYVDEAGAIHEVRAQPNRLAFTVSTTGVLLPLQVERAAGRTVTDDRLQSETHGHTVRVGPLGYTDAVSVTTRSRSPFTLFPVGERWIGLSDDGTEALLIDARGGWRRLTPRLTVEPRSPVVWLAMAALVLTMAASLRVSACARARLRALDTPPPSIDVGERGCFVGILKAPAGAVLMAGSDGRLASTEGCELRVTSASLDLGPRPILLGDVPLIDGDPIFVFGTARRDDLGGPMRASRRLHLGPSISAYFIGHGGASELAAGLAARESGRVGRGQLAQIAISVAMVTAVAIWIWRSC